MKLSGSSGCNRYFAGINVGELPNDIAIGQIGGTRMACPGEVMKLESRFLKTLSYVNKYSFENDQLALIWKHEDTTDIMLFNAPKVKSEQ